MKSAAVEETADAGDQIVAAPAAVMDDEKFIEVCNLFELFQPLVSFEYDQPLDAAVQEEVAFA